MKTIFKSFFMWAILAVCPYVHAHNVGLLIMATGKYIQFVEPLIHSANKHFCTDHSVTYFVFTDGTLPENFVQKNNVVLIEQKRLGWPHDTLLRCQAYNNAKNHFTHMDYIFACDADMLFADTVGSEILSARVATQHPGFVGHRGTYETQSHSTACVQAHEGSHYFAGGFYGGSTTEFLRMTDTMVRNIYTDLEKNFIAVWHDESHLNRYFITNPPTLILSPEYCYPGNKNLATQFGGKAWKARLIALIKDHKEFQQ
jgi:histo-blood group ABO system transferase